MVKANNNIKNMMVSNFHCITCFKSTNSGKLAAIVLMQKAMVVPNGNPFNNKLSITGITPVAFEYSGMPIKTAIGTDHHCPCPRFEVNQSFGTKPCKTAPKDTPIMTYFHTREKISNNSCFAN